jgi:repressor LexA
MTTKHSPLPLTAKEKEVLQFIESFVQDRGIAPTFQEIKANFGFASFNSVQRYLQQLEDKRYLRVPGDNKKRAIQLLQPSNSYANLLRMNSATTHPNTNSKKGPQFPKGTGDLEERESSPPQQGPLFTEEKGALSLPLLGRVAAGAPIEAFLNEEFVEVPSSLIRYPAKTFGLVVQGESMIEDGILDGDLIFVQKQTYANNGQTVVATISRDTEGNSPATVKRFYLHPKSAIHSDPQSLPHPMVELRPANSQMKSLWVEPDRIAIQGIVVALLRRL